MGWVKNTLAALGAASLLACETPVVQETKPAADLSSIVASTPLPLPRDFRICDSYDIERARDRRVYDFQLAAIGHLPYDCAEKINILAIAEGRGISAWQVGEIYQLAEEKGDHDDDDRSVLSARDLERYIDAGGDLNYLFGLFSLRNSENELLRWDGFSIMYAAVIRPDLSQIRKYALLKDSIGEPAVHSGFDSYYLIKEGVTLEDVEKIRKTALFRSSYLLHFASSRWTIDDLKKWRHRTDDGFIIQRYLELGLTESDFNPVDTEKPNALVSYAAVDSNGTFSQQEDIDLFYELKKSYDVWVVVGRTENAIYQAMERMPSIDFWTPNGHGAEDGTSLLLGYNLRGPIDAHERYELDVGDTELFRYAHKFSPNATIFLHTCSGGYKGREGNNLANFMRSGFPTQHIISAKEPMALSGVKISSYVPFRATIDDKDLSSGTLRDITYLP